MADSRKQNNYTGITAYAVFSYIRSRKAHGQKWKRDDWKSRAKEFEVADYF